MKGSLKKRFVVSVIVLTAILAIGSCSVSISGPSFIRISNTSGIYTIDYATIRAHNSANWNELLYPNFIAPWTAASFEVNPGFYDVWVTDDSVPSYSVIAYDVQVTSGNTTTLHFDGYTLLQ